MTKNVNLIFDERFHEVNFDAQIWLKIFDENLNEDVLTIEI
jgi:hypothetical protein